MKPLVGISCCTKLFGLFAMPNHAASDTYIQATRRVVHAVPVLLPATGSADDIGALLARLDGLILTGSRSNVQPSLYGGPDHPEGTPEDPRRDAVTLPLIRAALGAALPVLAICRGLQELNVALGGSLHQRLQDLPGRLDHSAPLQPASRVRHAHAHAVRITPRSWLHRVAGASTIGVNSLHNQGIDRLGHDVMVDAVAPDGTIEAVHVAGSPGFAVGVQWHPEYEFDTDPVSAAIFHAFGHAVAARAGGAAVTALAAD